MKFIPLSSFKLKFTLQSSLCPFKQAIELNIIIENLMFLMSDASNKKIFISFAYIEDFRSEAERIRLLNFHTRYSCAICDLHLYCNNLCVRFTRFSPYNLKQKDVSHDTPLLLSIIFCFLLLLIFLLLRMAIMRMARLLCSVQGEVVLFRIHHLLQECRLLLALIIMKVMFPLLMLC